MQADPSSGTERPLPSVILSEAKNLADRDPL
jgi:hypothetical protein